MNSKGYMDINVKFSEIELAGDVKSFVSLNTDSCENEEFKEIISSSDDDDLLKVTKQVASPLKIIDVQKVTDELLDKAL
jgi:hypothetical protein